MANTARFENQQIVSSLNLFIDTERATVQGDTQSRGDDIHIQFEGNSIEANDGEVIRMTLKEFSMPNTMYMIDFNNSRGIVKATSVFRPAAIPVSAPVLGMSATYDLIDRGNYADIHTIATTFADKMRLILNLLVNPANVVGPPAKAGRSFTYTIIGPVVDIEYVPGSATGGTANYVPPATGTVGYPAFSPAAVRPKFGETDTRILKIQFNCKEISTGTVAAPTGAAAAHEISNLIIQLSAAKGDLYTILGGERMDSSPDTDNTFNSLNIDFATAVDVVSIQGYFPMTRFTEPSIYIRTNLGHNALEMSVLQANTIIGGNALVSDVVSSDIIGKINRWSNAGPSELITYNAQSDEFFVNVQQRKITNLRLFLTDSKGRKLGRFTPDNDNSGTAAGRETTPAAITVTDGGEPSMVSKRQSELGNFFFSAVLRIDVIKASCPTQLESEIFSPPFPGSKSGGILPFTGYAEKPILRR